MSKLSDNEIFEKTSFLHGTNSAFIEQMYEKYLHNPLSVPTDWQTFFSGISDQPSNEMKDASWSEYKDIKSNNSDLVFTDNIIRYIVLQHTIIANNLI